MPLFSTAKKHLAAVRVYQPGKPIEEVEREYGLHGAIKLASNENAFGPSPKAVAALRTNLANIHRYPDGGCFYLKRGLAARLKRPAEGLVLGNGSDEVLVMLIRAFAGPGDEIVIADPTFLIYEIAARVERVTVRRVPMRDFHYDLDAMRRNVGKKTRLVFVANPDNPVGTFVSSTALRHFLRAIPKNVIVVVDEAYYEYARACRDYPDTLSWLGAFPNLVIVRTFSKAYGLAGLRIGYAVTHASIAAAMNRVREPFNVNGPAQVAALAALDDRAHLEKTVRGTAAGRAMLRAVLEKLGIRTLDTVTNFVLADLGRPAAPVYEALLRRGVIVRPMQAWGLDTFIRITVGKPAENRRFIQTLKEVFP